MRYVLVVVLSIASLSVFAQKSEKIRHHNDTASYARGRSAWVVSGLPKLSGFSYVNEGSISLSVLPSYSYMVLRRTELRAGAYSYFEQNRRHGDYWIQWQYAADMQLRYYTPNTKWFAGAEYMIGRWHMRTNAPLIAEDNSDV